MTTRNPVVRIAVYLPLLLPILAAVSARYLASRLEPRLATWLLTGSRSYWPRPAVSP